MSWYKNYPELFVNYGGWNVKGFFKLKNSTSSEMFSRLNKDIIITASDKGYGKCGYLSIDGGKYVAYLPLDIHSGKDVKDIIPLEKCCVVVMSKYGEDDIYRIIESEGVTDIDDSRLGVDIFEHVKLYDTSYKEVSRRKLNSTELSHLNINLPGVVGDNGHGGYYCKLFAKGSSTQFYNKTVDPLSEVTTNDLFDITKCEVRSYKRADSSEIKIKIFIPKEAKDLSRIESLNKHEDERRKKEAIRKQEQIQIDAKLTISRILKFIESNDVEVETINKEYQHLCSLIGIDKAAKYKPYIDNAVERVNERKKEDDEKKRFEEKQRIRNNILKKRELYTSVGYWSIIWIIALLLYLTGGKEYSVGILKFFAWIGPLPLLLLFYIGFKCPPYHYVIKSVWAKILLVLLWIFHVAICIIAGYNGFL